MNKSNTLELLSLKKVMSQRLVSLMERNLSDKISVDIEFVTDNKKFETAVEDCFGHFKLRDDSVMRNQQQLSQQQQHQHHMRHMERQTSLAAMSEVRFFFFFPFFSMLL